MVVATAHMDRDQVLHHADVLSFGLIAMTAEHEAAPGRRLAPEIDERSRSDRSGAEQKRTKPGPGRIEGQCGEGKCEDERDRLAYRRDLGALDRRSRHGSGGEKIGRVLGRERDPGERAGELGGDHHQRRRERHADRAGRAAASP